MARKNDGIIWHLMDAPWWVSILFSLTCYVGLTYILPALAAESDNFFYQAVSVHLPTMGTWFAILFLIPAPIAFCKQYSRKRSYQITTQAMQVQMSSEPLDSLNWLEFESYVGEYFKQQGYEVKQFFSHKPDGGVDIWMKKDGELTLVQCKHWRARKVGIQVLREMYGVMIEHHAAKMIIVTSGDFTSEAVKYAADKRLWLVNGSELAHMVADGRHFMSEKPKSTEAQEVPDLICPRCNSNLVTRKAKRGRRQGEMFYGCSSFPKCRYTRELGKQ
ncbi:restriction endonuclease [Vibrio sp. SCSIO 43136]|uniref:restriction endonuclease n=1 Tax=Vibrio sp. SCSIO 43136 TaxID=2819101 RepID=UPI002074F3F9|nr:restriction endonuclease [Vibrio sp. SCSIO 43136]USD64498.1 restriction endonuclease [Vibrio sp. SCSIO 43136]